MEADRRRAPLTLPGDGNRIPAFARTSSTHMLPDSVKDWYLHLVDPVTRSLVGWRVSPNLLSAVGFLLSVAAALTLQSGAVRVAGVLILLAGSFDVFDGAVARRADLCSTFGSFLDSTLDRISEVVLHAALLAYFVAEGSTGTALAVLLALGGGLMVSYTRAKAEALAIPCRVGLFQRPERVILLGVGALLGAPALRWAVWALAILSNATVIQRILHVRSATRGVPAGRR